MLEQQEKQKKGFAAIDVDKQREIARKGGNAISKNREHMANIGRKGGQAVSRNSEYMSEIGRRGGKRLNKKPHGVTRSVTGEVQSEDTV